MEQFLLVLAVFSSVFMGVSIGASTVASAFGPVNSARSANVLRSALLAGLFALFGAVLQGGNVTQKISSGMLKTSLLDVQAASILLVAAFLVIISVREDYPMPTAFTVVGAVIGSGLAFSNGIKWSSIAGIIGYWVMIPFLAVGLSFSLAWALRHTISKESSEKKIRYALLIAGAYVSYSAGASAVGLAVGPMVGLISSQVFLLALGGCSILLGAWLYSPRIIRAISFDYSNIGPRRSFAALTTAAVLAQVGIFLGIPISFNEAIVAAVIGSGLVEGKSNTDKTKLTKTVAAWSGAFLLSGFLTFIAGLILQAI